MQHAGIKTSPVRISAIRDAPSTAVVGSRHHDVVDLFPEVHPVVQGTPGSDRFLRRHLKAGWQG